jgi:hypothetical protein
MKNIYLTISLFCFVGPIGHSQALVYKTNECYILATHKERTASISSGDIDNDIDIIIGNSGSPNVVYLNKGSGANWEKMTLSDEAFNTYDIIVSDLNNDGRPDIIEANSDEINRYYLNIQAK